MKNPTRTLAKALAVAALTTAVAAPVQASAHERGKSHQLPAGMPAKAKRSFPHHLSDRAVKQVLAGSRTKRQVEPAASKPRATASHNSAVPPHYLRGGACYSDRSISVWLPSDVRSWYSREEIEWAAQLHRYTTQTGWDNVVQRSPVRGTFRAVASPNGLLPFYDWGAYWIAPSGDPSTGWVTFRNLAPGWYAVSQLFAWRTAYKLHGQYTYLNGSLSCRIS